MRTYSFDVIVIGSGAAGFNAACRVSAEKSVAIVTEGRNKGTSRNTGSDKQTYYKLGLSGDMPDSVMKMAQNLFDCGCVDGDNALCEAALSVRNFINLCELGVEFPSNRYGEYVGYKTDHDLYARATSAGPLTSKFMTEALEKQADKLGIPIFDGYYVFEILKSEDRVCGLMTIEIVSGELVAFRCADIIMCTGGPAGIYRDSVYPIGHTGSTGLALMAGAKAQNLTEWQYGLASIEPRWNVSGNYMQVLPRFLSIDKDGNEREFLLDFFEDKYEALSTVFLKGYQWPFDSEKILNGSSVIDLLVYRERVMRKRKVYLDFTRNPFKIDTIDFSKLSEEAFEYLKKANACFGRPIDRLETMNQPAIELYRSKGKDIGREYLEISLCAQHNNGGLSVDLWWQTSVKGLFAAGECAGTHGVARPGGSALNAGQAGSFRAAQYICERGNALIPENEFVEIAKASECKHLEICRSIIGRDDNIEKIISESQRRMSDCAAAIRDEREMKSLLDYTYGLLTSLPEIAGTDNNIGMASYYKLRDILCTSCAVLASMLDSCSRSDATRGSSLYHDKGGYLRQGLEEIFRFSPSKKTEYNKIIQTYLWKERFICESRAVRPIPRDDDFFENVWKSYRKNRNIY